MTPVDVTWMLVGQAQVVLLGQAQAPQVNGNPLLAFFPPTAALFGGYYLLIARPERRRRLNLQKMLAALKRGDHIMTTAGIYAVVAEVDRETGRVTLTLDPVSGAKMQVALAAIARLLPR